MRMFFAVSLSAASLHVTLNVPGPERRPYTPHVTIGRTRRDFEVSMVCASCTQLASYPLKGEA